MSSSSDSESDPRADRRAPSSTSAVRPATGVPRPTSTLSGVGLPPKTTTTSAPPGEVAIPISLEGSEDELALEADDMERVTLVELPAIARYGSYELLGRIAYGGMAEIFLARELGQQGTQRMMVVKRVLPHVAEDPHFVDMFIDEARLAMQLNHPSICHVYNFGEAEGTYYIAMEWVNGKPLSKIIRRAREHGGLPIPIALKIIAQVAEALDYAHRASDAAGEPLGIVHRDVSPQNVMVSYDGIVKLLDFGIAKATSHSTRTEAGVIKGKFAYMSPQQCVGEPIDARADIFALGICLFEALTGKNPFRRKTEFETMTKIVGEATPSARERRPEIPEAIEEVIETALMKQPERRYHTAGDMQVAIEAVIPTLGVPVNAARVGEYVSGLFADDVRDGPNLDTRLATPPATMGSLGSLGSLGSGEESIEPSIERPPRPGATVRHATVPPDEADAILRAPARSSRSGPLAFLLVGVLLLVLAGAGAALAWVLVGMPRDLGGGGPVVAEPAVPTPPDPGLVVPGVDPPPVVAPSPGSVYIESVPPGATITLGARGDVGRTPLEVGMIEAGTYPVTLSLEGHRDFTGSVTVEPGGRATILGELERIPTARPDRDRPAAGPPGQLSLNTRPWSKVYLGRRLLGTTPVRVTVPSGPQRLLLVDRDGTEHRRTVRVPPGGHVTESFDLRE